MRKESTAYLRISFRKSDFYLGELFPHLASLKDEREKSLEIKKIIFSRSKLDNHNKFQQEESKLPKLITFRLHISERELWLDPIRKIILATPKEERAAMVKRIIFEAYSQSPPEKLPTEYSIASNNEFQNTSTHAKYDIEPTINASLNEISSISSKNKEKNDYALIENSMETVTTSTQAKAKMMPQIIAGLASLKKGWVKP